MTTIQCPRCGTSAPYGAPGCRGCGAAFVPPPGSSNSKIDSDTNTGWSKKGWAVCATLAALAAIGLAGGFFGPKLMSSGHGVSSNLAATGGHKSNLAASGQLGNEVNLSDEAQTQSPDLTEVASQAATSLQAAASTAPTTLAAPAQPAAPTLAAASGMPQDIHDWLEHLRKTEASRSALAQQQITQAMTALTQIQAQKMNAAMDQDPNDDPSASLRQKASSLTAELQTSWNSLVGQFDSVTAPSECATAKAEYDATLVATGQMMVELISAINSAAQNPEAALSTLRKMQGTSGSRIDSHASATDNEVSTICGRYQTPKWFSISKDIGDAGLLSQIGMG